MHLKLIFKGKLMFGNERTFNMAHNLYLNRIETLFKTDLLFSPEDSFDEETFSYTIPTLTSYASERAWRSTTSVLAEISKFAITGNIQAWALHNGRLIENPVFEPDTDKTAVQAYLIGRSLVTEEGKFVEANEVLSKAIEKYKKHADAYAWRGYVKLKLKDFKAAKVDFTKSIDINPQDPNPFYGRAKVSMLHNEWENAIPDLEAAVQNSIPWQTVYWRSKVKIGECLFHLKRYEEAEAQFSKYIRRKFKAGDPNLERKRRAYYMLGKTMLEIHEFDRAMDAFDNADAIKEGIERAPDKDNLYGRGLAKQGAGKKDFIDDIQEAAKKGSKEAKKFLKAHA